MELLTSDLTNKDEALFIIKANSDNSKDNESLKEMTQQWQWSKMTQKTFITNLILIPANRAEYQKLRATEGNVSSQAMTEIRQQWIATNNALALGVMPVNI